MRLRVVVDNDFSGDPDGPLQLAPGRPIRVYTRLDVRLMLEDLYAKLARANAA